MFPIVQWAISHLAWKFHDNPLYRISIMFLTDRDKQAETKA